MSDLKEKIDSLVPHAAAIGTEPVLKTSFKALLIAVKRVENPSRKDKRKRDTEKREESGIKKHRKNEQHRQQLLADGDDAKPVDPVNSEYAPIKLSLGTKCYICKQTVNEVHGYYDSMCVKCGDLNFIHRNKTANLTGINAVVTGGRVKIGHEIALKLLRAGASVTVTTRFVNNAWVRFREEEDFLSWKDRLFIDSLDLLSLENITAFVEVLKKRYSKLDILINNAAQTLARERQFYAREVQQQSQELKLLCADAPQHAIAAAESTALVPAAKADALVPYKKVDEYGQPATDSKSWVERVDTVSVNELATVTMVNQIAPTMLVQLLTPLMEKKEPNISFIVNVTAMEGVFNKIHKTCGHPHTNMAKAALMMLTRTSATDYWKRYRINMYSPDTGYIDQMSATDKSVSLPLDTVDGAARVLHRVFVYYNNPSAALTVGGWEKDYVVMDKW